jgi:cation/acetate symporter
MAINFLVAIVISRFTPPPPERVQELVEEIRLPRMPAGTE